MASETITERPDLIIRRQILEPGEATPWHTDVCHRFTVVVRGERLRIEFRDGGMPVDVTVRAGQVDWDAPGARVHRGVNAGDSTYEEIVTFLVARPGEEPQPERPRGRE